MKILIWYVHGGWMQSFLRGPHDYLIPVTDPAGRVPDLPARARAVTLREVRDEDIDVVILQRLEERETAERVLGRTLGVDIPALFLEHNTPKPRAVDQRHPFADQRRIPIVHVTHFNALMWDSGIAPTHVIEHGIADGGYRYTGAIPALGVVVNEPVRRGRVTGTDLLPRFADVGPLDVFGIDTGLLPSHLGIGDSRLRVHGDVPTSMLHAQLARRRLYLHLPRWTSLGMSLLEAMSLGMPVLALATTEASRAIPREAGAVSADVEHLAEAARELLHDPDLARAQGRAARAYIQAHFGLSRFLEAWDALFDRVRAGDLGGPHESPRSTRPHQRPEDVLLPVATKGALQ